MRKHAYVVIDRADRIGAPNAVPRGPESPRFHIGSPADPIETLYFSALTVGAFAVQIHGMAVGLW